MVPKVVFPLSPMILLAPPPFLFLELEIDDRTVLLTDPYGLLVVHNLPGVQPPQRSDINVERDSLKLTL